MGKRPPGCHPSGMNGVWDGFPVVAVAGGSLTTG